MAGEVTKRGERYLARIRVNGQRLNSTHNTKRDAKQWIAQVLANPDAPTSDYTLDDLAHRYLREYVPKMRSPRTPTNRIAYYQRTFPDLFAKKLHEVTREDIEDLIDQRMSLVKSSSVNRDLNVLSSMFAQARRWRMMTNEPFKDLRRPSDPPPRDRRVSQEEVERILVALDYSPDYAPTETRMRVAVAFLFAIETAMRLGELCQIRREHVHAKYVHLPAHTTKTNVARNVPLSVAARKLIKRLDDVTGDLLFDLDRDSCSTIFSKATKKAGVENLTFHDTRHEATTRLAQKLPVLDLARVTGHRDLKQLMTYYNKDAKELADLL